MNLVPLPAWTAEGVLPPIDPSQPASPQRSPYVVSLTDFVLRLGQTVERRTVLEGYLRYRQALHAAGLTRGFQWLDGSFLENIEMIESRAPHDIDVVTFFHLPAGKSQRDLMSQFPDLFPTDQSVLKSTYHVDGYVVDLGTAPERLTQRSAYWYSLWSHRRNQLWKGFVQIDLAPSEDAVAMMTCASLGTQGAQP